MENWRKFLSEAEQPAARSHMGVPQSVRQPPRDVERTPAAAETFIAGHDQGLEDFVSMLKQIAHDPEFRKLAFAGRQDDAGAADETLIITQGEPVPAKDLTPTQMDIDMGSSLGDQMTNKWDPPSTEAALQRVITMPSPGGVIPLLTYNNKYILDGHHRWSQVMMTNPDGLMTTQNLSGPALPTAEVALKATQLAIAALAGNVVTKGTKINLLSFPEEAMGQYVRDNITPEVLELLVQYEKITKPDKEEAAQYYMGNLAAIKDKPPGAFEREAGMPQADESGVSQARVTNALNRGSINFDDPEMTDIKKQPAQVPQRKQ
jgi:hypothetical protein